MEVRRRSRRGNLTGKKKLLPQLEQLQYVKMFSFKWFNLKSGAEMGHMRATPKQWLLFRGDQAHKQMKSLQKMTGVPYMGCVQFQVAPSFQ